jgi:hypothetical protein
VSLTISLFIVSMLSIQVSAGYNANNSRCTWMVELAYCALPDVSSLPLLFFGAVLKFTTP